MKKIRTSIVYSEDKKEVVPLSYQEGLKGESGTLNVPLKNQIN